MDRSLLEDEPGIRGYAASTYLHLSRSDAAAAYIRAVGHDGIEVLAGLTITGGQE